MATPAGFTNFLQGDPRIMEYGVGEDVPIGGVAGYGAGISHYVRRVSKQDLAKIPSEEEYKRIKEEERRIVRERYDKLRPWAERWHRYMSGPKASTGWPAEPAEPELSMKSRRGYIVEKKAEKELSIYKSLSGSLENLPSDVQEDIDSIEYTEDPTMRMLQIDIDTKPININNLIEAAVRYAKELRIYILREKYRGNGYSLDKAIEINSKETPSNEEVIDALFKLFVKREEEKVREAHPPPKSGNGRAGMQYTQFFDEWMSQRMMEKLPKIQTVVDQVRARLSIQSNLSNLSALPSKSGSKINVSALYGAAPPPAAQPLPSLQVLQPQNPGTEVNLGGRRKTHRRKNKKSKRSKAKTKSKAKRKA